MPSQASDKVCLVRGSINIDEFYHLPHIIKPGQTLACTSTTKRLGGKGGNQAKALALAGGQVLLDATVGDDPEGKQVVVDLCELKNGGEGGKISSERIGYWKEGGTGKAVIQLSSGDGENSIIILAGANAAKTPAYSPLIPPVVSHLLLANEVPLSSTIEYLSAAHAQGVTTVWNPSPMPTKEQLQSFPLNKVSWLLVNEGELEEIVEATATTVSSSTPASLEQSGQSLIQSLGNQTSIACTLGSKGVIIFQPSQPPLQLDSGKLFGPVKDTTGAGDCFAGYFVAGLMRVEKEKDDNKTGIETEALKKIVEECMAACAYCVEKEGAQDSYALRSEVLERLR